MTSCFGASHSLEEGFFHACEKNDISTIKLSIFLNSKLVSMPDESGYLGIEIAIIYACYKVVKILLEEGVDCNLASTETALTLLDLAILHGHDPIIQLLLEQPKIDILIKTKYVKKRIGFLKASKNEKISELFDRLKQKERI